MLPSRAIGPRRAGHALLVLLCVVAGALVATPAQAAAPPVVRVMTFNICGGLCRGGEVPQTAANVAYQIHARKVHVALLQEVCHAQFLGVRARLRDSGYTATFHRTTGARRCGDDGRGHTAGFGLAIVVHGRLTGRVAHALPSPSPVSAEKRALLGVHVSIAGRPVFVATSHTAPGGPNLAAQVAAIHRLLTPIARRGPVLLGGDLNMLPDNPGLDLFYRPPAPGGTGEFHEADGDAAGAACRCGRPTFDTASRKIDYLFGHGRYFRPRSAVTTGTAYSDHRIYVGEFTVLGP